MPAPIFATTQLDSACFSYGNSLMKKTNRTRMNGENAVGVEDVCHHLRFLSVSVSSDAYLDKKSQTKHVHGDSLETMQMLGFQNMDGDTFLHHAIIMEQYDLAIQVIDYLSESNLLNMINVLRQTPLHLAVITRQTSVVRKLLAAGAQTNVQDHRGDTPLHIACRTGAFDIVSLLIENLSSLDDLEIRNYDGFKCIHLAVLNSNLEITRIMLKSGADINAGDAKSGRTIFHWAAEYGKSELVDLILSRKDLDVAKQTYDGMTAFDLAKASDHFEILGMVCESS